MSTINIQLKAEKGSHNSRYGYITSNDRVHNNVNLTTQSYGAQIEGEMGLARHQQLKDIFNHPNAVVNAERTDADIAAGFLKGRAYIKTGSPNASYNVQSTIDDIGAQIAALDTAIDTEIERLPRDSDPAIEEALQARKSGSANTDPEIKLLEQQKANLEDQLSNNAFLANDFLLAGEVAYNPDFPASSFDYSYTKTGESRANDSVTAISKSPNVGVPSSADDLYANPDFGIDAYTPGHKGGGGFGPRFETGIEGGGNNIIEKLLGKYESP